MGNNKLPIDSIIEKLGYSESDNYIESKDIENSNILSIRLKKTLKEIKPYSLFMVQEKPFILFFDRELEKSKCIHKLIWNAQIPVVIFCGARDIKIYNGYTINKTEELLSPIEEFKFSDNNSDYPFSYWNITNQLFWEKHSKEYKKERLNEVLLNNIRNLTDELKSRNIEEFATKLVLRIIFIRFLIDRGVDLDYPNFSDNVEESKKTLVNILKNKKETYDLFQHLREKFNGNLFDDLETEKESDSLTNDVFFWLSSFIEGNIEFKDRQSSLFELYDFNIIPVELISNIYEILLGREEQKKDNSFYTPNYLVEYILNKTLSPHLKEHKECSILDPSCGSGAFLANSYRRIIENNLSDGEVYIDNGNILKDLLLENIYGVDVNGNAIDVTIFSLYLTLLDYKNPKKLSDFILPTLKGVTLFQSDFFDDSKLSVLKKKDFDFIIGNPPWGNTKTGLHMDYCRKNKLKQYQQNSDICKSFVFRVKEFSSKNTQCCFIIHSTFFYMGKKTSQKFRDYLLAKTKIKEIIEMSSIRDLIFKDVTAPAAVIIFKYTDDDNLKNKICYTSLKPNIFAKLFSTIVVEKTDIKYVKQNMLLEYGWAWKTIVFGFSMDFDIIKNLKKEFPTIKNINSDNNFFESAGIKLNDGELKDANHLIDLPFVNSKDDVHHFYISDNTTPFKKHNIDRPRDKNLFKPPHCVIKRGLSLLDYRMRSAYNDKEIIFASHIYMIKGTNDKINLLYNLSGLFNSKLFAYLNLMLGSSLGVEREICFMREIFEFPYIYDDRIVELTKEIHELSMKLQSEDSFPHNVSDIKSEIISKQEALDDIIFEKFGLKDNVFIDYALNVQIPQLINRKKKDCSIYRPVNEDELRIYSKIFFDYFSLVYGKSNKYIEIKIYPELNGNGYSAFELSVCNKKPLEKIKLEKNTDKEKEIISRFSLHKASDLFYQVHDIIKFGDDNFYIIKLNQYKNWHPAIAQLDLSNIIANIFSDNGGSENGI